MNWFKKDTPLDFEVKAHRGAPGVKNPLNRKKDMFGGNKTDKELQEEFAPYYSNFSFFYNIGALAAYVKASFADQTIANGGSRDGFGIGKIPDEHYTASFKGFAEVAVNPTAELNIHGNTVTNVLHPIDISPSITFTEEVLEHVQDKFDTLFGKGAIDLSKNIPLKENEVAEINTPQLETGYKTISSFKSLKMNNTTGGGTYAPEKFDIPYRMPPALDKIVLCNVRLMGARCYGFQGSFSGKRVYFTLQIDTKVVYPLRFALWLTYSKSLADFIPKLFKDRICELAVTSILNGKGKKGKKKSATVGDLKHKYARVMHLGQVKGINENLQKEYGAPIPRVNKDGYAILREGNIIYVPDVDNTTKYVDMLRKAYDPQTGRTEPTDKIPGFKNMPVYTDWMNDAFGYTNDSGKVNSISLQGAIPLDDVTISNELTRYSVGRFLDKEHGFGKTFMALGEEVCMVNDFGSSYSATLPIASSFSGLCNYIDNLYHDEAMIAVLEKKIVNDTDKPLIDAFINYCKLIGDNLLKYKGRSIVTVINYKFYYDLFGKYFHHSDEMLEKVRKSTALNTPIDRDNALTSFKLPNMPGIKNVLPHQAPILTLSERGPKYKVLEVGAGGGKCQIGSALVSTNLGILSLKEIHNMCHRYVGDGFSEAPDGLKVMTSQGMRAVSEVYTRKGKTFRVVLSDNTVVEGLPEHKLHNGDRFKRLDDYKEGEYIKKYIGLNVYGDDNTLPEGFEGLTAKDAAILLGFIVSEGCNSEHNGCISITNNNPKVIARIKSICEMFYDCKVREEGNTLNLHGKSLPYIKRATNKNGASSARVNVPDFIKRASKNIQQAFLRAVFEGDGTIYYDTNKSTWILSYSTISPDYARYLKTMLENMGFYVSLYPKKSYTSMNGNAARGGNLTKRRPYELYINYRQFLKFHKEIGFLGENKNKLLDNAALWADSYRSQDSNKYVFGLGNVIPQNGHTRKALNAFLYIATENRCKYPVLTAAGFNESTIKSITRGDRNISKFHSELLINGWDTLERVLGVSLPDLKEKVLDEHNSNWVKVKSAKATNKNKTVYDLSVPGPHDYMAYNILNHNTFTFAADMLIQIANGRASRAAVACPPKLVKEYCTELNAYSLGKVNALPITMETVKETFVRHMKFDKKGFISYLKKAPKNTIFVISFGIIQTKSDYFTDQKTPYLQFGEELIDFYPMAQIFRQVGIDVIAVDESHFLKNENTDRAKAIKFITPLIGRITIGSGTLEKDNAADAPSQYGIINPAIYGSKDKFIAMYGSGDGNGKFLDWKSPQAMLACKKAAEPYAASVRATKIDWSQLLPEVNVQMVPVHMTENQQRFYDSILKDAIANLESSSEFNKMLKEGEDSDKASKKIEDALKRGLNNVEQFIYAPDQNVGFRSFLDENGIKYTKQDFISATVPEVDKLIEMRLKGLKFQNGQVVKDPAGPSKNKIIVAYINKSASRHAITHSKYRNIAVHYATDASSLLSFDSRGNPTPSTGKTGMDMLDKFRTDDKIKIVFADITSIREGFNLQVADTFIRAQTPWSPGEIEQEQARVLRPDVYNKYGRESVYLYWLQIRKSHVIAKTARLISKMVAIHQKNESENRSWTNYRDGSGIWPKQLEHISMNLDFLKDILSISGTKEDSEDGSDYRDSDADMEYLKPQFAAYQVMEGWEVEEFHKNTIRLAEETARRLGKPVEEVNPYATDDPVERRKRELALRISSMLPNDGSAVTIEGSKSYFVPIQPGSMPVDPYNVNIIPIVRGKPKNKKEGDDDYDEDGLESAEDENKESEDEFDNIEDNAVYDVGDIVYTEFGIGEITALRNTGSRDAKTIKIQIPGLDKTGRFAKDELWLQKTSVFIAKEPPLDIGPDGKPTAESVEENSAWKKRLISFHKQYRRAKERGTGIVFINNGVPSEPPVVIEDKSPVVPPKKPVKPAVKVDKHPSAEGDKEPIVKTVDPDKLKRLLDLQQERKDRLSKNQDTIPDKPAKINKEGLSIDVDVINGMIGLQFYSDDPEFKKLQSIDSSIRILPPYMDVHMKTARGAKAFINMVDELFVLPGSYETEQGKVLGTKEKLMLVVKRMGGSMKGASQLSVTTGNSRGSHLPLAAGIANFYRIAHNPPKNNKGPRPGIKMYPTVWNDELFMCIPIDNQRRQAKMLMRYFNEHKDELGYPNQIGRPRPVKGTAVKLLGDSKAAIKYVEGLSQKFNIDNLPDVVSKLKSRVLRRMITAPTV